MWSYFFQKLYSGDTTTKQLDPYFDECLNKLRMNHDDTHYEFIEKIHVNDGSMPDLDKCTLILVKYNKHIALNQITGLCVYAKDSKGNNLPLIQQKHPEIDALYKVFDKFNTKIFNQGVLMTMDNHSFQEVDALIYNILIVTDKGEVCKMFM